MYLVPCISIASEATCSHWEVSDGCASKARSSLQTERETIAEREALEAEEQQALEREKARLLQRKAETHDLVVQQIAFEEAAAKSAAQAIYPIYPDTCKQLHCPAAQCHCRYS